MLHPVTDAKNGENYEVGPNDDDPPPEEKGSGYSTLTSYMF